MEQKLTKKGILLKNVSFSYKKNRPVLKNINYHITSGTFLGITGVNGSGKSTFIYLLNGLIPNLIPGDLFGKILFEGKDTVRIKTAKLTRKIGLVFQNPDFSLFNLTVEDEIKFGLNNLKLKNAEKRLKKALDMVGMGGFEKRDPQTLSIGEKQKISLAQVLSMNTPFIALDEPAAMLDYKSTINLYRTLKKLNSLGKTIITIEHDTDLLLQFCREVIILDQGQIKLSGKPKNVLSQTKILKNIGIKRPHL